MILDFVKIDLTPNVLQVVIQQMLVTIFQAMLATTLGALIALPFSFLAAKNLTGRSPLSVWIYYLSRGMLNILRSIEALLYVVIFVFWVGIGPFAGMLALAVTSFALIGKLFSEAIENIENGSDRSGHSHGRKPSANDRLRGSAADRPAFYFLSYLSMGYQCPHGDDYWICRGRRHWLDLDHLLWFPAISQSRNGGGDHRDRSRSDGFCQCKAETSPGLGKYV